MPQGVLMIDVIFDDVSRHLIEKITAIGIHYDFGEGHEQLGWLRTWFGAAVG